MIKQWWDAIKMLRPEINSHIGKHGIVDHIISIGRYKSIFLNNGILRKWNTMCTVLEKKTDQE